MGIKDLYKVIDEYAPESRSTHHLSEFVGYSFAVDISIFLNKYIKSAGDPLWMNTFFLFLCTLKKHGIKTVCIFDGPNPPKEKLQEQEARRVQGQKSLARLERCEIVRKEIVKIIEGGNCVLSNEMAKECESLYGTPKKNGVKYVWLDSYDALNGITITIERLKRATLPITSRHRDLAKEIVQLMGLPTFQADGEAEALCSYLAIHGHVDGVLTEDTDVLCYGTPWMIAFKDFKLSDEKVHTVHLETILDTINQTQEEFRDLCILLSCDYNERVVGYPPDGRKRKKATSIGWKGAHCMINEYRRLEEVEKYLIDADPLIYRRCREIFSIPSGKEVKKLIGVVPLNNPPNIEEVEKFIKTHKLTISSDYIKSCWKKPTITFLDSEDEECL